jgi:hypothetical protein
VDGGDFCALGTTPDDGESTATGLMAKTARCFDSGLGKRRRSQGVLVGAETIIQQYAFEAMAIIGQYGKEYSDCGRSNGGRRTDGGCV